MELILLCLDESSSLPPSSISRSEGNSLSSIGDLIFLFFLLFPPLSAEMARHCSLFAGVLIKGSKGLNR